MMATGTKSGSPTTGRLHPGEVNRGFNMNYEVFDSTPSSIDPANGGGGLQGFNGTINAGHRTSQSQLLLGVCCDAGHGLADKSGLIAFILCGWKYLQGSSVQPEQSKRLLHWIDD